MNVIGERETLKREPEPVTQAELESLLSSLTAAITKGTARHRSSSKGPQVHEARVHDFIRSDGLPRSARQAIETACLSFARAASSAMSTYLHEPFEMSLLSVSQLTYSQFARSVPDPTAVAIFGLEPMPGRALLELNPAIAFGVINRLLGGQGEIPKTLRSLSEVERVLLEGAATRLISEFTASLQGMISIQGQLLEITDSVEPVGIAKPMEAVLVASYEVAFAGLAAMASFCLPVLSLKVAKLGSRESHDVAVAEVPELIRQELARSLLDVKVDCLARLGRTQLTITELASLEVGDVLVLDRNASEPLDLLINGVLRFRGRTITGKHTWSIEIMGREEERR